MFILSSRHYAKPILAAVFVNSHFAVFVFYFCQRTILKLKTKSKVPGSKLLFAIEIGYSLPLYCTAKVLSMLAHNPSMNFLPFFSLLLKLLPVQFARLEWFGIEQPVAQRWQPNQSLCLY